METRSWISKVDTARRGTLLLEGPKMKERDASVRPASVCSEFFSAEGNLNDER